MQMSLMIAHQITSQLKDNSSKAFNLLWWHTTQRTVTILSGSDAFLFENWDGFKSNFEGTFKVSEGTIAVDFFQRVK